MRGSEARSLATGSNAAGSSIRERWNNRALFHLLWPLIIEQLLAVTMGAADTFMISSVGEFAVSGINIIDNINNLLVIAFIALSTGGAVVCSQYIGRDDYENSRFASRQLVYIVFTVSLVISIFTLAFRAPVIRFFYGRLEDDVMSAGMRYFMISALSYPFLALYNGCAALFRASGNSRVPMKVAVLVNIMNVGGNALFIFGLRMGVTGAGIATLLSRFTASAILIRMLVKNHDSPVSLARLLNIKINTGMAGRILNIGLPAGLEQSMFQFGRLLTQRIFPVFGTGIIAANAVSSTINSFSFMMGHAFIMAILTVIGQSVGAGDYGAAKMYARRLIIMTWITIGAVSGLSFIFRNQLTGLFNLSPEARAAANSFLSVHCFSMMIGWTLSFAAPSLLRAAGDAKYVMIVGIVSMWTVRVSAAYFITFTLGLGPIGVWIAMGADFIVRGILFYTRWKGGKWQKMKVI